MAFVWRRIYTGIDVGEKEFDDFRKAVSKGPLLILPDQSTRVVLRGKAGRLGSYGEYDLELLSSR